MIRFGTGRALILATVGVVTVAGPLQAAEFYYGGYDAVNSVAGTPDLPVTGPFVVAGQTTFYSDAAGTLPNAAGTGVTTGTSTGIVLGGIAEAPNYQANGPAGTGANVIRSLALNSLNGGTNTLNFGFTSGGYYTMASGGAGVFGVGITFNGNSNWNLVNGGSANSPLRFQNSISISGNGSGTLSIPFNFANAGSGAPSLTVAIPNGTVVFSANNDFGSTSATAPAQFTLNSGTVDFRSIRPFGNSRNQVRLNGGTLTSTTGTTITTVYTGTAQTGTPGGYLLGGNLTFAGASAWSLGTGSVTLSGNRTITANTGGATGATIGGAIGDNAGAFGLTVSSTSTGKLTLTGANTYTGTTTVAGGTLVLGANAQNPVLTGAGGADIQGSGKLLLSYAGTSPAPAVKTALDNAYAVNSNFATGQIKATTLAANQTIGYGDNGTDTVTIRLTLPGDADLDGDVDFNDFLALQTNYGAAGTRFDQGNFDYNGVTDFNDFLALQTNFGQSVSPDIAVAVTAEQYAAVMAITSANAVPEPASLALLGLGAAGLLLRRR